MIWQNSQRNLMAIIPVLRKISYHLFELTTDSGEPGLSLVRRAKWHPKQDSSDVPLEVINFILGNIDYLLVF